MRIIHEAIINTIGIGAYVVFCVKMVKITIKFAGFVVLELIENPVTAFVVELGIGIKKM